MTRIIAALLMMTLPASAQDAMTQEACELGWQVFSDGVLRTGKPEEAKRDITSDGWCRVKSGAGGIKTTDFKDLKWRATGLEPSEDGYVMPTRVTVKFDDIDMVESFKLVPATGAVVDPADLIISLERNEADGTATLSPLQLDFGTLGTLEITAKASGLNLSSQSAMQMSLGTGRLHEVEMVLDARGVIGKLILPTVLDGLPEAASQRQMFSAVRDAVNRILNTTPSGFAGTEDRAAITAFLDDLPNALGELEITLRSDTGFGALQVGAATMSMGDKDIFGNEDDARAVLSQLLSGVELDATWTP